MRCSYGKCMRKNIIPYSIFDFHIKYYSKNITIIYYNKSKCIQNTSKNFSYIKKRLQKSGSEKI